jgi:hypothetical protein
LTDQVEAQQSRKNLRHIGFLNGASLASTQDRIDAFRRALCALGYVEGLQVPDPRLINQRTKTLRILSFWLFNDFCSIGCHSLLKSHHAFYYRCMPNYRLPGLRETLTG